MKNSMDNFLKLTNSLLSNFIILWKILPGGNSLYIYSQLPFVEPSFSPGSFISNC